MDKTGSGIAIAAAAPGPAVAGAALQSAEPATEKSPATARSSVLDLVCLLRVGIVMFMASIIAPSAWRARRDPWELALVAGPCALLAAIFVCLHRADRLTPDSPPGERWRLHVAVWVLATGFFCLVAYRTTSRGMPAPVVVVVWCLTSFVVAVGFYMLVLYKDQLYQSVNEVDTDAAGDGGNTFNKIRPSYELV
ncbi:hypothetical protein BDA96_01G221000 [Sorghum bicolor]|uniref:Uncharacterized protein n=2 Tax=Sorghum bicolor TaxID=4558 RepID=A0A921S035_SORBI|nr:hypothetical protein BDA96_01G221000 [Sorghum bicolor]OQU91576.1 hypothetical protein SORBI_3001G207633 [Sorghum bicolor]